MLDVDNADELRQELAVVDSVEEGMIAASSSLPPFSSKAAPPNYLRAEGAFPVVAEEAELDDLQTTPMLPSVLRSCRGSRSMKKAKTQSKPPERMKA